MAKSNTIQFKGTFDGSQILNELKKVRASMSEAGASDTLFKNVDKDIVATEKLVNDMMAQIQKGFSNTKEITAFEKQINKLQTNFLKISTGLKGANLSENFTFNSPEIAKLTQEINRLTAAQDRLKESSKNALATAGHNIGFNQDDVKEIQKAIDANEDLEESLIRVAKAKEKAAKANAGQTGMATDAGKEYIANAKAGLSLEDLGATAMSGKTAKGPGDARARGAGGKLKRGSKGVRLDEDKAMAAVNETYQQALEETVRNGGSAVDAVEAMKKALADYGVQLSNTERLQENFAESLEGFYTGDIVGVGQKSAVTKAQKAGRTNAQGEFELSDDARRQIVNNSQITAYNQNLERTAQAERELATERERLAERAEQAQEEYNNSLKKTDKNVEEVTGELREQASATRENVTVQEKMSNSFDRMKDAVKTFLSISSAVNGLKSVIRSTFEDVKNLDKSFAEIAMVTDYSVGQMWESYNQYSEMANKLGQSTQGVIQASGLFYQQGLDTAESLALTEDTMKLATLAGTDFSEATSQMTAALRGFKMEMDEGNRVTDVYSELAAKAAADVQGIAYAMSKTASIAESAGMEFETTSAFLTQMIETTQEAPENIGTAMKTIIARFTELKENVAGTDKSAFDDLDYNKVDVALKSVGVSLKDTSGQFRDLDDVFLELSGKWDTLDRNTQRYIATIAAGSRQQSRFIAMMDNYDRTVELVDTAYNSAGKSSEQFAKYQDTLEYKLNQLKNTWEQFRVQFFNSDFFKGIIDGLNTLVGKINELSGGDLIALGAAIVVLGKTLGMSLIGGIQSAFNTLPKKINAKLNEVFNGKNTIKSIRISADITQANNRLDELKKEQQTLEKELGTMRAKVDITQAKAQLEQLNRKAKETGLTSQEKKMRKKLGTQIMEDNGAQEATEKALNKNLQEQDKQKKNKKQLEAQKANAQRDYAAIGQTAAVAFSTAFMAVSTGMDPGVAFGTVLLTGFTSAMPAIITGFTTAMTAATTTAGTISGGAFLSSFIASSGGIMLIVVAAIAAITGMVALTKSLDAKEEAKQFDKRYAAAKKMAEESKKEAEEARSEARKATEEVDNVKKLKERYDELHNQTVRTTQEQEEYNELVQQIQEEFPQIITSYNEVTGELQVQNDLWDKIIEKSEILAKQERKEATAAELTSINDQLVVDKMDSVKNSFEDMDIFANADAAKVNLGEFEKYINGEIDFYNTEMARAIQQIQQDGIKAQIEEDSDTDYDKITNTDMLAAYGVSVLSGGILAPVVGAQMGYQEQQNSEALAALDYNSVAELIGYQTEEGGVLKFDAEGNATVVDEFGQVTSATTEQLEHFEEAILNSETGLEAQLEKQKELINQEQELIEKQAALSYATQYMTDYEANLGEELAEGQKNFMTGVIANMTNEFDGNASEYMKTGNNTFFDALGGAWDGPSDNSLSDWEDIDGGNVIHGVDKDLLKQAGFEGEFTGNDVKNLLIDIKGSEEAAAKFWEENQGTAAGQLAIQNAILTALKTEGNEQLINDMEDIDWTDINSSYEDLIEEGATQEEINAYNDAIAAQQIEAAKKGQGDLVKWIGEYGQDTTNQYNDMFEKAEETFSSISQMGEVTTKHLEVFTQQAQNVEDILGNYQLGVDYVEDMNQLMLNSGITDPSVITNALSSFDISSITAFNKEEIKKQFIDGMSESMSSSEAGALWEKFFALSEDYNLINIEIGSVEVLEQGINESYDKIEEQISGASGISDAISAQVEKGFLNFSESNALRKTLEEAGLNFEDYISFDEDGTSVFDFAKMKEDYKELLPTAEEFKQQAIDALDVAIEEIDLQIDMIKVLQSKGEKDFQNLKITEATTQELKTQLAYMSQMGYIEVSDSFLNEAENIRTVSITEDDIKLSKEQSEILEDLNEKRKNLVDQKAEIEAGKNMEVYEDMVKKANAELDTMFDVTGELEDSTDDLAKATEDLAKAQKEYEETLHGTAEWLDEQDPFKALTESVSLLEKKLEGLKSSLEEVTSPDQAKDLLNAVTENRTLQIENLTGQMQMAQSQYDQVLDFIQNGDYAQYYSQLPDGTFSFDIAKWYEEGGSDEMGDALGEMATKGNDAAISVLESQQKINNIQKEQEKESEERLKNYVSLQDQILEILKQNAEEEVKTQKEKYDALKEADNDYLSALEEAIEKQRKLREQENAYEDLAQKEKKLALMQRDTSGANQKEVNELQKEVEEQRQELLDSKVDEMIDKLKQQTELQTEIRDMEIEIKENELESKNYLAELAAVESSFHNADDVVAWMLENNKELEDMSIEQQEAKILEWEELGTHWAAYLGEKESGYTDLLTTTEENIEAFAQAGTDAIEGSIERIITNEEAAQLQRELDAKKALEDTLKAYDTAMAKHEEYLAMLEQQGQDNNKEKNKTQKNKMQEIYDLYIKNAPNASVEGFIKNQGDIDAYKNYIKYSPGASTEQYMKNTYGITMKNTSNTSTSTKNKNQFSSQNNNTNELQNAFISDGSFTNSEPNVDDNTEAYRFNVNGTTTFYYTTSKDKAAAYENLNGITRYKGTKQKINDKMSWVWSQYATGGLVNYTGPAWVDGTPSKPEAFLSAQDTERIGNAAKLLADLPILNSTSNANNAVSSNIGDTSIEIHINVESLASDYDVDQMIERVKNDILDVSKPTGTSVILHK